MSVKWHIILDKRFEVGAMIKHILDDFLAMLVVVSSMTFQLITKSTEQTVTENKQKANMKENNNGQWCAMVYTISMHVYTNTFVT